jgi:acetolactate synthase I/II/III large subunit
LSLALGVNDCVAADAGSAFYVMGQAFRLFPGQRFLSSGSLGAMGLALPAANGAAAIGHTGSVVCVTGDSSLMTNLHELATMKKYKLDLKLFVINIDGYVPMRNTQRDFCKCHYVGVDPASGVYMPPIDALVGSFGMACIRCVAQHDMEPIVSETLAMKGASFA